MSGRYELVAIKRLWVPEWLWWFFRGLVIYQPLRWILSTPVADRGQP